MRQDSAISVLAQNDVRELGEALHPRAVDVLGIVWSAHHERANASIDQFLDILCRVLNEHVSINDRLVHGEGERIMWHIVLIQPVDSLVSDHVTMDEEASGRNEVDMVASLCESVQGEYSARVWPP